jgi:pimeloyl-ACP methyl ester carboxylesterase
VECQSSNTDDESESEMYQAGKTRNTALVVVAALVGLAIATPAGAQTPAVEPVPGEQPTVQQPNEAPQPTVVWGACPPDVLDPYAQLQCTTVPVPLDYDNPGGERIELMVSRLASANAAERRGVLMLNPGGPGGSGLAQPNEVVGLGLPGNVMNSYDVLGMDTRGIGHSAPVSCGFTVGQNYLGAVPPFAVDSAAVATQAEVARGVAAQCAANDANGHMRHMSTANMARDLDQIRIALGEEKLNYFGLSYGTALGAAYASMFPDTSDRIVLDSNVGDTHLNRDGIRHYGLGAEETFPDFAEWAAERNSTYELGSSADEVRATYFELAERLDTEPMLGVDGHSFRLATFVALYNEMSYAANAQLWQLLLTSDTAGIEAQSNDGETPGAVPEPVAPGELSPNDNTFSVFLAVTCNDSEFTDDIAVYQSAVEEDRERFPIFGASGANIMPCAFWAYEPSEPPVAINDNGPQNILILQNERDPVTPLLGGELLREKFEHRSILVSADSSGHGVYVYGDNACADGIATAFLVDGTLPADDQYC